MLRRACIQQEEKANAAPANDWTTSMHKLARTPHWGICQEKLTEHPHKTFVVTAATAAIYSSLASYIYTTLKVGPLILPERHPTTGRRRRSRHRRRGRRQSSARRRRRRHVACQRRAKAR